MNNDPTNIGQYRVIRKIGEGGMGAVFEAIHQTIERRVALKLLKPDYVRTPDALARFLNEARVVNRIEHPGLVQISDHGLTPEGAVYIVMEYLHGETLRDRLTRLRLAGHRLPIASVAQFGWQLADALAAVHQKHVVHRDLKPDNLMIVPDPAVPGGERVKVLDFGIAKLLHCSQVLTCPESLLGTPRYMAPEQCRGLISLDGRADVYSLGVMLYESLAGKPPFEGPQFAQVIAQQLFDEPAPLSQLAPIAPLSLVQLVHALLEKEPARRPPMDAVASILMNLHAVTPPAHALPRTLAATIVSPAVVPMTTLGQSSGHQAKMRLLPARLHITTSAGAATLLLATVLLGTYSARSLGASLGKLKLVAARWRPADPASPKPGREDGLKTMAGSEVPDSASPQGPAPRAESEQPKPAAPSSSDAQASGSVQRNQPQAPATPSIKRAGKRSQPSKNRHEPANKSQINIYDL